MIGSPASPGAGSDPFVSAQGSVDEDEPRPKRSAAGASVVFNQSDRPRDDSEQLGDVPVVEQIDVEQFGFEQNVLEQNDLRSEAEQRLEQPTSHTNGGPAASNGGAHQGDGEPAVHSVAGPAVEESSVAGGGYSTAPGGSCDALVGSTSLGAEPDPSVAGTERVDRGAPADGELAGSTVEESSVAGGGYSTAPGGSRDALAGGTSLGAEPGPSVVGTGEAGRGVRVTGL